jgi:hypothetical protein
MSNRLLKTKNPVRLFEARGYVWYNFTQFGVPKHFNTLQHIWVELYISYEDKAKEKKFLYSVFPNINSYIVLVLQNR